MRRLDRLWLSLADITRFNSSARMPNLAAMSRTVSSSFINAVPTSSTCVSVRLPPSMRRIAWRSSNRRMNSTRVSTRCATDRCTSSGSAFQRNGEPVLAAARSSSARSSWSSAISLTVTPPALATTREEAFRAERAAATRVVFAAARLAPARAGNVRG